MRDYFMNSKQDTTESNRLSNIQNIQNIQKRQLAWACRRGMLELDILFNRYLENFYDQASLEHQEKFQKLLACQDQELFEWLLKKNPCDHPELLEIIRVLIH